MEEYIDVNHAQERYERTRAQFMEDETFSPRNRELVLRFLQDCAIGKTNPGKAKKRVGPARLHAYLNYLRIVMRAVQKDLDQVTEQDLEKLVEDLDSNRIPSRKCVLAGTNGYVLDGGKLSGPYRQSVKQGIKKFYKWLLGNNRTYPAMVEWIETWDRWPEVPSLTAGEIGRMLDRCKVPKERALIQLLFDGGFRLGELLNVRLVHVRKVQWDDQNPKATCYAVRIPFSKTLPRTILLPMENSTRWLEAWFEDHPAQPKVNSEGMLEATELQMQLFPMAAKCARAIVRRMGMRALQKRVYPHLLRHSSATYWCNRLTPFKLARRFGWTLTSRMPNRYIDREGIDEFDVARVHDRERRERTTRWPNVEMKPREESERLDRAAIDL